MKVLLPAGVSAAADPILEILKKYKTIAVVGLVSESGKAQFWRHRIHAGCGVSNYSRKSERDGSAGREELRAVGGCAGED